MRFFTGRSLVDKLIMNSGGIEAKVAALDGGADDYLTKPFHTPELFARMRVLLRHAGGTRTETSIQTGDLRIEFATRAVFLKDHELRLTATEYALLRILALNLGKVMTHSQLLREVWGPESESNSHYLRIYMRQLRKKIELDASAPKLLINDPGIGYRLMG
jgi:two-component system KDP operon response regulator KdpE